MALTMLDIRVTGLRIHRRELSGQMQLSLMPGEIHELSGPNGCGKSLLLDAACGVGPARGVRVTLGRASLDRQGPAGRWRRGLRRMFQAPILPDDVRVADAVLRAPQLAADADLRAECLALLGVAGIDPARKVGQGSHGQRRLIELCASLLAPRAVLLDEPFSGLAGDLRVSARTVVQHAAASGRAILVVDHLRDQHGGSYSREYSWVPPPAPTVVHGQGEASLIVLNDLSTHWPSAYHAHWSIVSIATPDRPVISSCSIDLEPGSAIVLLGTNGSGKSTVMRALAGFRHPWGGLSGQVNGVPPVSSILLSPQPPKLVADLSVEDNLRCMLWQPTDNGRRAIDAAWTLLEWLGFSTKTRRHRRAGELSGGEAAVVAAVGAVASDRMLLFLDEPFEGLSVTVLPHVLRLFQYALDVGKSIVLATHEFPGVAAPLLPSSILRLVPNAPVSGTYRGGPLSLEPIKRGGVQ